MHCLQCGYITEGLPPDARCPECGGWPALPRPRGVADRVRASLLLLAILAIPLAAAVLLASPGERDAAIYLAACMFVLAHCCMRLLAGVAIALSAFLALLFTGAIAWGWMSVLGALKWLALVNALLVALWAPGRLVYAGLLRRLVKTA